MEQATSLLVEDGDQRGYKTWNAVFRIVMGNSGGHFAIHRDNSTNTGILSVVKVGLTLRLFAHNVGIQCKEFSKSACI